MTPSSDYSVLAFYCFVEIGDPQGEVARQRAFLEKRGATGRIYVAREGINAQLSLPATQVADYLLWMKEDPRFREVAVKIQGESEHAFPRLTIKVRPQLVALDVAVDLSARGSYLSPREWREKLEARGEETILLDVRNRYEWEIGHFDGALLPSLENFRDFPPFIAELKERCHPKEGEVMMYCTGGIRCELYSALLKKEGFERVYQLEGGVLHYGEEEQGKHWKGKLFVFDDRLAVDVGAAADREVVGRCAHCASSSDIYYNCADSACNELFLSCAACAERFLGCCSQACMEKPGLRPYQAERRPKPFRRKGELAAHS